MMDFKPQHLIYELAGLSVDAVLFGIFYKLYRNRLKTADAIKEAPYLDIDASLKDIVLDCKDATIPYVVITGVVKAATTPIRSQYVSNVKGVIQERVTKEHKMRWSPLSRLWTAVEHELKHTTTAVPFALAGTAGWRKFTVDVIDPLEATELSLTTMYDQFEPLQEGLGGYFMGWLRGERSTGFREIENMLTENSLITGVGELIYENDRLKLRSPSNGLGYFLTSLSRDSLIIKVEEESKLLKIFTAIFGCIGLFLIAWIVKSWYVARKQRIQLQKETQRREEARRQRLAMERNSASGDSNPNNSPTCVICWTNPIELLILECGHACLCLECGNKIDDTCPVCRSHIVRIVPAYLP